MIIKSVVLPLAPVAAFELFTQKISEWWPLDRRHTQGSASEIFLLQSGRFYERGRDGHEVEPVRSWELPNRILLDFFIATGLEKLTEVEITFTAQESQVSVIHRPKSESEDLWTERAPRYLRSWDTVLAALRRAAAACHP